MMNRRTMIAVIGMGALVVSSPASAYIDPGTGSAILQGLLGALAAAGIAAKLYWHRLLRFLGIRKPVDYQTTRGIEAHPGTSQSSQSVEQPRGSVPDRPGK
jgi:hypothetical protein